MTRLSWNSSSDPRGERAIDLVDSSWMRSSESCAANSSFRIPTSGPSLQFCEVPRLTSLQLKSRAVIASHTEGRSHGGDQTPAYRLDGGMRYCCPPCKGRRPRAARGAAFVRLLRVRICLDQVRSRRPLLREPLRHLIGGHRTPGQVSLRENAAISRSKCQSSSVSTPSATDLILRRAATPILNSRIGRMI